MAGYVRCFCAVAAATAAFLPGGAAFAQQPAAGEAVPPPPSATQIYQQTLGAGAWIGVQTLRIEDVAWSFGQAINGKDARESALINAWHGIYQDGGVATVLFTVSAMDAVFSDMRSFSERADCLHLNDGRWWCEANVERLSLVASFYLEREPPLGEAELAVAARPTTAPPR